MEQWREKVVGAAENCLGTPYVPRGIKPGLGLDCGTLLWIAYRTVIDLPQFPADYPADWAMHREDNRYLDWIAPFVQEVRRPIRGGISVWRYGRNFSHGGIRVDRKNTIHAYGRQAHGCVQRSHNRLFTQADGTPRDVLHFDLKPGLVL